MEGSMFYWILWVFWVYLTFMFNKKNHQRLNLSVIILLIIILSDFQIKLGDFEITASGVFMLLLSYIILSKEKNWSLLYIYLCSVIITLAYAAFNLFEIFDPIWIIFQKEWMMGVSFCYLAVLLQKTLKGRLLIIVCGTIQGEIVYAYFLSRLQFPYPVSSLAYLDVWALITALLLVWSLLENTGAFLQNHFSFMEKQKQKSS
ncbi:hypothetical protein [Bacillus sp. MRMR6]|uniref:YphA family membrane protein n=1 Tax=Bacillus sp. MRMR6 TaxID=1928617 RepID=UPI00095214C9|nr:hypothetical protein [Bacillus sp. MRMR6]OLS40226.1 hypothetical protein BTR25_10455 [Bacillus sp. MRMR6]